LILFAEPQLIVGETGKTPKQADVGGLPNSCARMHERHLGQRPAIL